MHSRLLLAVSLSFALSACQVVSNQPGESWRQVAFPLELCDGVKLENARKHLTNGKSLEFSKEWVCVTEPAPDDPSQSNGVAPVTQRAARLPAKKIEQHKADERAALLSDAEQKLRTAVENPFLNPKIQGRPSLGIALAGGGSKAGAFGIGVLAGLADGELLDSADYISSVSGGSYSAYFYYTHRIFPLVRSGPRDKDVTTKQLFWDCVQRPAPELMTKELYDEVGRRGACDNENLLPTPVPGAPDFPSNHYQAFMRCQQDVFNPGECTTDKRLGSPFKVIAPLTLVGNIALTPVHWVSNVIFDWGFNVSQAAHTYRRGIGMAYGTTLTDATVLGTLGGKKLVPCDETAGGYALDCRRGTFLVGPKALDYQELREGLLNARGTSKPLPFWILNATGPRYRSAFGWLAPSIDDTTNQDMFEMTAASHGSGRWGYVPAPMSLHQMDVLDSVGASAAFADSSQLAITSRVKKWFLGVGLKLANFDWGTDITNYNLSPFRSGLHKSLPIPLYWTDSGIDRTVGPASRIARRIPAMEDRQHTAYIRLIDGGNAENLGLFALMKRRLKTIVVADSASDKNGTFQDLCAFRHRLQFTPKTFPRYIYVPGLKDFDAHCDDLLNDVERGYPIREWKANFPILVGCLRVNAPAAVDQPCHQLGEYDTRLLVVKPAIHLANFVKTQTEDTGGPMTRWRVKACQLPENPQASNTTPTLNCETAQFLLASWEEEMAGCQTFPQHGTATMTVDSSPALFSAYRELGRQYLVQAKDMLTGLTREETAAIKLFEETAEAQGSEKQVMNDRLRANGQPQTLGCRASDRGPWRQPAGAATGEVL